jgi:hypothetical protein
LRIRHALIRARTGDGRERAKARGVRFGRRKKLSAHQRREAIDVGIVVTILSGGVARQSPPSLGLTDALRASEWRRPGISPPAYYQIVARYVER